MAHIVYTTTDSAEIPEFRKFLSSIDISGFDLARSDAYYIVITFTEMADATVYELKNAEHAYVQHKYSQIFSDYEFERDFKEINGL